MGRNRGGETEFTKMPFLVGLDMELHDRRPITNSLALRYTCNRRTDLIRRVPSLSSDEVGLRDVSMC